MRRKDREMDRDFGLEVIDKAKYGIVSMINEEGNPHGLPLSIIREGEYLYFHSAKEGEKVGIFSKKPIVSIAFVGDVMVPENYTKEEMDEISKDESKAKLLISSVFTTEFESVIVKGRVEPVDEKEEKIKAVELVCRKYTPDKMDYFQAAIKAGLPRANVYRVKIEAITAKRKKYDDHGKEMKWGRTTP